MLHINISSISFIVGWLYFKPQIFYDTNESLDFVEEDLTIIECIENKNNLPLVKELTTEKREIYLAKLENIFASKELFLKKDLVIRDIADETGISVHHISSLINSEFSLHFQDYVNLKRIEYFREKINDPDWKDLSLEGMAWGSGFKSRTTCFRAFIKHTGKSPSEFFKVIRINPEKSSTTFYLKETSN